MTISQAERLLFGRLTPQGQWTREGLCTRSETPDLWFPKVNSNPNSNSARDTAAAKAICLQCPVRTPCAQWAIEAREPHGIWGALSEQDRERLRRKR